MDAPVEQKVNATYFKCSSTQVTCCEQTEANFHLYLHQISGNPSPNQTVPVNPPNKNGFGMIVVNDWTIHEGRDPSSKVIARAQGMHAQSGQNKAQWYTTFNMVFEDDSFKGSTLEVRGAWDTSSPIQWAVVGGTGQFTLAQGIVSGTKLVEDINNRILELFIRIFYRPIEIPN